MGLCKMMIYGASDSGGQITSDFSLYKLSLKEVFYVNKVTLIVFFPLPECTFWSLEQPIIHSGPIYLLHTMDYNFIFDLFSIM